MRSHVDSRSVAWLLNPRRPAAQATDYHFVDSVSVEVHNFQPPAVNDQHFAEVRNSLELFEDADRRGS